MEARRLWSAVERLPNPKNRLIFWLSLAIYAGAVTFTYAALWLLRMQS